jgi:chaperonin GroES
MAKKVAAKSGSIKLVPLGDKVVLKRQAAESKTAGGIVLPDSAKDKPQKDGTRVALTVKPGDRVIFSSYAGDEIKVNDEEYLLLRESDILATY